jgi:hypothetical protein
VRRNFTHCAERSEAPLIALSAVDFQSILRVRSSSTHFAELGGASIFAQNFKKFLLKFEHAGTSFIASSLAELH